MSSSLARDLETLKASVERVAGKMAQLNNSVARCLAYIAEFRRGTPGPPPASASTSDASHEWVDVSIVKAEEEKEEKEEDEFVEESQEDLDIDYEVIFEADLDEAFEGIGDTRSPSVDNNGGTGEPADSDSQSSEKG